MARLGYIDRHPMRLILSFANDIFVVGPQTEAAIAFAHWERNNINKSHAALSLLAFEILVLMVDHGSVFRVCVL